MKDRTVSPEPKDLAGGSYQWWPPRDDHVILFKLNPVRFEYFDRFVRGWNSVRVLDVGCGGGYACEYLARRGAVVHGTDLLRESLAEAGRHATETGLEIDYRLCTIERLPFDDASVEVVTCFDVLEHVSDKSRLLSEIHRVLMPGGWLFLDTFTKSLWSKLFIIWLGEIVIRFIPRGTHEWRLFIKPAELQRLLTMAGFGTGEFAGIRHVHRRSPDEVPMRIFPDASKAVMFFGAIRKPIQ